MRTDDKLSNQHRGLPRYFTLTTRKYFDDHREMLYGAILHHGSTTCRLESIMTMSWTYHQRV